MTTGSVEVRDMLPEDEYFVSTCTHENELEEIDAAARRRLEWLKGKHGAGLRVKVALIEGERAGFLYAVPVDVCPWGPIGEDLLVFPCLFVKTDRQRSGAGRALVAAGEDEARRQGFLGVCTMGYYWEDFWFMPAAFFEGLGYEVAGRTGSFAVLWKPLDSAAQVPRLLEPSYEFEPVAGKVVVDLFWHSFCQTCNIEAERVRDVASEFGEAVVLREYCADNRDTFLKHQIPRAIYINGEEIGWGYEAPKEGIRSAIATALEKADRDGR